MNSVQDTYAPPRLLALCLGGVIFAVYQLLRLPVLMDPTTEGEPLPLVVAIGCSLILGYGVAMLWWLFKQTLGQFKETFRPTRGRIFGSFFLLFFTPVFIVFYIPFIMGGMLVMVTGSISIAAFIAIFAIFAANYVLASMIIRHTYERRKMRFGLFCLSFWAVYCAQLLYFGVVHLNI